MPAEHPDALRASSIFRKEWEVYQSILAGDHMYHSCLYSSLKEYLECRLKEPFSILDIGCGDSDYLARMLSSSPKLSNSVTQYTGVDLSEPAMKLSYSNMSAVLPASTSIQHNQQDMLSFLETCPLQSYDVVTASFSVHHLSVPQKQRLLQLVLQVLKPGGCFCLVDVFLDEGETRPAYLQRYKTALDGWSNVPADQKQKVFGHVSEFDFPEELDSYAAWFKEASSGGGKISLLCSKEMYKAVAFEHH